MINDKTIVGVQICNSQVNLSPTKMMYSFSRAERFPKIVQGCGSGTLYNLPPIRVKRGASMGYGRKYDFIKDAKRSCPSIYNSQSDFDLKHPNAPCFSFGVSRDHMKDFNNSFIPGPGNYKVRTNLGSNAPKYSMKGSKSMADISKTKNDTPGPDYYFPKFSINPRGKFYCSKYKNVISVDFGKLDTDRLKIKKDNSPSPFSYNMHDLIGKVFESKFKSTNGISMGRRLMKESRNDVPGPGAYCSYSEFGVYGDPRKKKRTDSVIRIKKKSSNKIVQ